MLPLFARIDRELSARLRRGLSRKLVPPLGQDFSSNDYFCLAQNPRIIDTVKQAATIYGYGSTSSRFIGGERDFYAQVESNFARFKGTAHAIMFSSGYAANIGVINSLIRRGDFVLSDRLNHASIADALILTGAHVQTFNHLDVDEILRLAKDLPKSGSRFLLTESLFSMDGDVAPLATYAEICREYDIHLIVDEAHGFGLYGANGAGLIDHFGISDDVLVSINGLGKAFGCFGAVACASQSIIDYIIQNARTLMYSTAPPPLALAAAAEALQIIADGKALREQLFANTAYLQGLLQDAQLIPSRNFASPIFPVILKDTQLTVDVAEKLQQTGFHIKAIRPPTVPLNSARLRISVNVSHSLNQLQDMVTCLRRLL